MAGRSETKNNPLTANPSSTAETNLSKTHWKLYRATSLPAKIPPPIIEVMVEEDGSNDQLNNSSGVTNCVKDFNSSEKGMSSNKLVNSRNRNSYPSENGQFGQQNKEKGDNLTVPNERFARTNSIRSSSTAHSLSVIREQYCCFSKWTRCERVLGATVGVMGVIIVILIVVIGFLSFNKEGSLFKQPTMSF